MNAAAISWTGAVDKAWSTPGNWSTGNVPTAIDEVFIFGTIPYTISIQGTYNCLRLSIGTGVSEIYIHPNSTLKINGQNSVNTDLLFIPTSCLFMNDGTVHIFNLLTSQENELLDIQGTFHNRLGGELIVEFISFTGTNSGEQNREAIKVGNSGELKNEGDINIDELDGSGIVVSGLLRNETTGIINLGVNLLYTGINLISGTGNSNFYNYGNVISKMNQASSSVTLSSSTGTEIFNYGTIRVENSTLPVNVLSLYDDFTNFPSGRLEIINSKSIQYGFTGSGIMEFLNEGVVIMNNPTALTSTAFRIRDGATVNNYSSINISGYAVGMSTTLAGNLFNQEQGTLTISGTSSSGFNNTGEVSNYGLINILNCGNESYRNLYTTVNFATGTINIENANGWGIRNARASNSSPNAAFQNYGQLNISALNDDLAIYNYDLSIFKQLGKIDITSASKIINLSPAVFSMKDTMNAAEFDNRGRLEFSPSSFPYVFEGDLNLSGSGTVDYYVSSSVNFRKIKVNGDLKVDGDLDLEFEGGFVPGVGQKIDLMEQTGSRIGFFENFIPEFPLNNHELSYSNSQIVQLAYNSCNNMALENEFLFSSGNWSTASNWSLGHTPFPCEEVILRLGVNEAQTVNMNSSSPEIAKLTIYGNAELIIMKGNTLTINREFKEHQGQEALFINEDGKLINDGTLLINNVDGGEFVENRGEIINYDILRISNGYNLGIHGINNFGKITNGKNGLLDISNLDAGPASTPVSIYNDSTYIENGISDLQDLFFNRPDGEIFGNGTILTPLVFNLGLISSGDGVGNEVGDLTINGDLDMRIGSLLRIDIAGNEGPGVSDGHDRITISADTDLGGDIEFTKASSFNPSPTDQFPFLYYQTSIMGSFSNELLPSGFTSWDIVDNEFNQLILMYEPSCLTTDITWTDGGLGNMWTTAKNWSNDILPLACHNVSISNAQNVIIDDLEKADIGYLEMDNSQLVINPGGKLIIHGNNPTEASLKLTDSNILNDGTIAISPVEEKPSIHMDKFSNILNNSVIILK